MARVVIKGSPWLRAKVRLPDGDQSEGSCPSLARKAAYAMAILPAPAIPTVIISLPLNRRPSRDRRSISCGVCQRPLVNGFASCAAAIETVTGANGSRGLYRPTVSAGRSTIDLTCERAAAFRRFSERSGPSDHILNRIPTRKRRPSVSYRVWLVSSGEPPEFQPTVPGSLFRTLSTDRNASTRSMNL